MAEASNNVSSLSIACTEFGLNLYKSLLSNDPENIFMSPFCLHNILSMTYFGADGQTRFQLKDILKLGFIKDDDLRDAYRSLTSIEFEGSASIANRIYLDQTASILDSFGQICKSDFNSETVVRNLRSDPEAEAGINTWAQEATGGKIKDLIPPGSFDALITMVLINAIYFKEDWDVKFDPANNEPCQFQVSEEETVGVDYMRRTGQYKYGYSDELDCSILDIPYKNNKSSMVMLLPNALDGLSQLEGKLGSTVLSDLLDSMSQTNIEVRIPKFSLMSSTKLVESLSSLGLKDAFVAGKADLSKIDGTRNLYISDIFHKACIDVNEEGTEAAAAGAVGISTRMLPPSFSADHPFLFFIRDNSTNIILFFGRLVRPAAKK